MSQKFVMLFLVSNPRVVSLDVAAKILIGEDHGAEQDKNKFKSESRIATISLFLKHAACFTPFKWRDQCFQPLCVIIFLRSQSTPAVRYS